MDGAKIKARIAEAVKKIMAVERDVVGQPFVELFDGEAWIYDDEGLYCVMPEDVFWRFRDVATES